MRAVFFRKEPEIEANEFCVEKVIVLPAGEYESFTKHARNAMSKTENTFSEVMTTATP